MQDSAAANQSIPATRSALLAACAICVAFGVYLRVQELGFPDKLTFDEHHFVENARNLIAGQPDLNDHPPLGKLLMAAAMRLAGDNAVGWRITALAFGLGTIVFAYKLGRVLFRDPLAGYLAAAFTSLDGFLIAYSRSALLDGILLWSALAGVLAVASTRTTLRFVVAGFLLGFACSIKLSGIALLPPILIALLVWREKPRTKLVTTAISMSLAVLVYYGQYAVGRRIGGLPAGPLDVGLASLRMIRHHAALTDMTNPLTSHWYTWFLPWRPITMRYDLDAEMIRSMTSLGNPLLWWSSAIVVGITVVHMIVTAAQRFRSSHAFSASTSLEGKWWPAIVLASAWTAFLAPWVISSRDSYIYHYLPSYGLGLVLLGGTMARGFRRWPTTVLFLLLVIAEVSVFYAPVWAQLPLGETAYGWRLFLPNWR